MSVWMGSWSTLRARSWKNQWLGAIYTTKPGPSAKRPELLEVRTQQPSFYADLGDTSLPLAVSSGWKRSAAAATRRSGSWSSVMAPTGFGTWPQNTPAQPDPRLVSAATYVWQAAHALYGEDSDDAKRWARQHLDLLWDGQVATVIAHLEATASLKAPVNDTLTYFRNNQHRMHYDRYRANGLQIGSGTIESGCKHVIAQRLKQAGMIWSSDGARAVAKLRTRLRPPLGRDPCSPPTTSSFLSPPCRLIMTTLACTQTI
ncbi:MAG: hypothetical protein U0X20_11540 [Caldilineaceae bacterium]